MLKLIGNATIVVRVDSCVNWLSRPAAGELSLGRGWAMVVVVVASSVACFATHGRASSYRAGAGSRRQTA